MKNCRIFVEKKAGFDLEAKRLCKEWKEALQLHSLTKVRVLNCYDIFGARDIEEAKKMIFSEIVTDFVLESFDETIPHFAVEFLPGQFDQRADSAYQCINLLSRENEKRSEEHTSELQSRQYLVCRLLLEKKKRLLSAPLSPVIWLLRAVALLRAPYVHSSDAQLRQHARSALPDP